MSASSFESELLKMEYEAGSPAKYVGVVVVTHVQIMDGSAKNKYVSVRGVRQLEWDEFRTKFYEITSKRFVTHTFRHADVLMSHPSSMLLSVDGLMKFLQEKGYDVIYRQKEYDRFVSIRTTNRAPPVEVIA